LSEARVQQKLAAILAADVVGYSRLMEADERATLAALDSHRATFRTHVPAHGGRIVDTAGDSVLAVFPSAIGAVEAAVAIQADLRVSNDPQPDDKRMAFRIGVNLGDIIEKDDGSIYGSGVNVAARLEGLAEPHGICLSGSAFEQVDGKIDVGFQDLGEHQLKNIARPVRAYRVAEAPATNPLSDVRPHFALPDKPSIAVLAFDNLSGDAEQEYLADGIAEDLITALSRFRWLFVTARNSTFAYKGRSPDVRTVGTELGVRYVLEGSVRKGANRVRVTAQLIDATSGNHLWADRFDRELADLFDLQDEITEAIISSVAPELDVIERDRARRKLPDSLDAWECYQRGLSHLYKFKKESNEEARHLFARATELDPDFATAYAALAYALALAVNNGFCEDKAEALEEMRLAAKRAIERDEKDAFGHAALARYYTYAGEYQAAIEAVQVAIDLNPNFANAHHVRALALISAGQPEESIEADNAAARLSPRDPMYGFYDAARAVACFMMRDYSRAIEFADKASRRPATVGFWPHVLKSSALAQFGQREEARQALEEAYRHQPDLSFEFMRGVIWWEHDKLDNLIDGLRIAGMSDTQTPTISD
jgi:TolB-like protein/class 3 adenylate cyclase/tetratricopeptide (TPR) repeat protein